MELDLTGIHKLAAEQGIDPETLDDALAEALRLAYLKTPHAAKHARVELDERSGNFTVWAADEIPVDVYKRQALHCTKIGLFGPAIESAAVVGQVNAQSCHSHSL